MKLLHVNLFQTKFNFMNKLQSHLNLEATSTKCSVCSLQSRYLRRFSSSSKPSDPSQHHHPFSQTWSLVCHQFLMWKEESFPEKEKSSLNDGNNSRISFIAIFPLVVDFFSLFFSPTTFLIAVIKKFPTFFFVLVKIYAFLCSSFCVGTHLFTCGSSHGAHRHMCIRCLMFIEV